MRSPQNQPGVQEQLQELISNGKLEFCPVYALLLAILEKHPQCAIGMPIYIQAIKPGGITTVDHLKDNLREKYVVTLADEHRAAEIMEAFRD